MDKDWICDHALNVEKSCFGKKKFRFWNQRFAMMRPSLPGDRPSGWPKSTRPRRWSSGLVIGSAGPRARLPSPPRGARRQRSPVRRPGK